MEHTATQPKMSKTLRGTVVSHKTDKTAVVLVERYVKHPKYGKYMRKQKRYKAHDAMNTYKEGDVVIIRETKPISKDKHFVVDGYVAEQK